MSHIVTSARRRLDRVRPCAVTLPPDQVRRLDEVARHRMASRSWVVRQAIADFLAGPGAARGGAVVGEVGRAAPSD
jgi:hypothetical protein